MKEEFVPKIESISKSPDIDDPELIPELITPKVPGVSGSSPSSRAHHEAHAKGEFHEASEEEISVTRIFILAKYAIPPENVIIIPHKPSNKPQRQARVFSILTNTENPQKNFYAEGHTAHVALNGAIIEKFGKEIGVSSFPELFDKETSEIKKPWVYRKGFLDPFHNGFAEFPAIRRELIIDEIDESKQINGLSEEEIKAMKKKKRGLPNWFLSADTSIES